MNQRTIKVWNKTVTINNVPEFVTDAQLEEWAKKRLLIESVRVQTSVAS